MIHSVRRLCNAHIQSGRWLLLAAAFFSIASIAIAQTDLPTKNGIRVPEGFTVELVAAAPLVEHPVMAGFDPQGRLFVADNAGLNLPAEELLKQLPNMIRMLEDTDGDGRFDRSTLFADKMTFPQGAVWYRGALYVASPPSIWRLEDTDGDGVADRREAIVNKFGFIGNAADIHGCFVTPTGRIAWCDGRHGHEFKQADGQVTSTGLAARIFTCRPDGSDVQVFCGGGMDNPVEVAFTAEGDTIGTMTFYNPDNDRHDALMHFVHGGVYPRNHPCTAEFKRTGELLPALSRMGVVAPSGLTRYSSPAWGEAYRDNFFSVLFNTHKVLRHVLTRQGGTFTSADQDFLVAESPDFHPTDVLEDADGSLLVIDTGGWFRIGCPTSQIAKPEIGGGIYRIRKTDAPKIADPRGLKFDWDHAGDAALVELLADPRLGVAERAIDELARRGERTTGRLVDPLFESEDYRVRQNTVWTLARIGTEDARMLLRQALSDDDSRVRQAAAHAIADLQDNQCVATLVQLLADEAPAVRREAAAALGRTSDSAAVPGLLTALASPADRFVEHALIYALIEINDPRTTRAGLQDSNTNVRRGALNALDQMDRGDLSQQDVASLLATDDAALRRSVVQIISKHADWGNQLVTMIDTWLADPNPSTETLDAIRGVVPAFIDRPDLKQPIDSALGAKANRATRLALLETIAGHEFRDPPSDWNRSVDVCLRSPDEAIARQAILSVLALDVKPFLETLRQLGDDNARPTPTRVAALGAAARAKSSVSQTAFAFLAAQLNPETAMRDRLAVAEAIGRSELNDEQLRQILGLFAQAGPLEAAWLLKAFEGDTRLETGLALVQICGRPALAALPADALRATFKSYPDEVRAAAEKLAQRASPDEAERAEKLRSLEAMTAAGDAAKGEEVFFGTRASCSACHRVAARGERIGPELTKIGEIRTRRDLLEAVVFPSASLARGFESFSAVTKEGTVHSGLLGRETATAIYLRKNDRSETRIDRADLDELIPSRTSIMPQGLDTVLSPRELADLVAYLGSLK